MIKQYIWYDYNNCNASKVEISYQVLYITQCIKLIVILIDV